MVKTETDRQVLVFVYGTLKSGGRLNPGLIHAGGTICGAAKILTKSYIMRSLGGYPALQKVADGSGTYIHGELWVVPAGGVATLDQIENYPSFYNRELITGWSGNTSFKALAYYIKTDNDDQKAWMASRPVIKSGEWDALANCPKREENNDMIETERREDCTDCGYWMLPSSDDPDTMECHNCGASVTTCVQYDDVPWEDREEDPEFNNSDFVVEGQSYFIINESGQSYGPYGSINEACGKIATVANEYGEDVRALYVGFRVYNRHLSQDELVDMETDTDKI
jgi:gamma-glutamylcyclotransferase (GGCT)/AIG2-like uncharacterized protein YtfP